MTFEDVPLSSSLSTFALWVEESLLLGLPMLHVIRSMEFSCLEGFIIFITWECYCGAALGIPSNRGDGASLQSDGEFASVRVDHAAELELFHHV
ncbi:hypothetical protein MPTK1_3g25040 [Marchantia polymorpha subsp. ruderalis]|uniref:Uncharacterized protein n=2 Tax=Marchantia polymorpha TaxID=3197 RepID=A0AAF6B4J2_MARPO|nr:hypothetical protein MARPO_0100s0017 [Marchantia polymorpha]PTQ32303.1 hypothetical protein MARPO_0100s0017 [Marchantia polymorpha]BBN06925.1 hypothetical protein Mp_3g25040 [Marchantia polymorpha subsp. ruderalis]BBN06926.1 hypothetical protein Mp_3g25040 [Marchantia polymorpha subsp. ruderalis]|eukprot:PTQ32302.1 hypothetical protein MARPO_0100s0017 [Marchantia polymorpha]